MDYEKKYNEALNWMRKLYPGLHGATKEDAEHYFPELRESKDKRARKAALEGIEYLERKLGWDAIGDTDILDVKEYLEKQKEQNPAEWSEEDEKVLNSIIAYIETGNIYATSKVNMKVWLKSLRPQPHWKPSEEQMVVLEKFVDYLHESGNEDCEAMESLYNDLKKLM